MIILKTLCMCLCTRSVAELNLGELLGSLYHIRLMTERIGEDNLATFVYEVAGGFIAFVALGDASFENNLRILETELLLSIFYCIDEVEVVGGILIVEKDDTELEIIF